ncbi:hypothetical protein BDF21DRAFT_161351 [Thamnidium elegans]|nr:hypothetical protein BDF21DRAFT_161351 [Thamnidium elegans]
MIGLADYKPDLFICEIKKPGCSNNKHESGFVKVHREMKSIIDPQVDMGIDDPT